MIKGLKKSIKRFLKKIRKSDIYAGCLQSSMAKEIIEKVSECLSGIDVRKDFEDGVVQVISFFKEGTTSVKLIAAGALLYFIAPFDAIPDIIPVSGLADDAVVIGVALDKICRIYNKA